MFLTKVAQARKAGMPDVIKPELASLYQKVPEGNSWLHEPKYDGYRVLVFRGRKVRLLTRTGKDWTKKFQNLVQALEWLPECVIDGELVFLDDSGISSFEGLQQVLQSGKNDRLVFYAFNMPFLQGYDLRRVPLARRKKLLSALLGSDAGGPVGYSKHIIEHGEEVFFHACEHRLEGNSQQGRRKNRVFIDYLRNGRGVTSISNFSTRSRAGAPIATPLSWGELADLASADAYRLGNISTRIERLSAEPWDGFHSLRQSVTPQMKQRLKNK